MNAILEAFKRGFSVETDIFSHSGMCFISHDSKMLQGKPEFSRDLLRGRIALNIKSDDSWHQLAGLWGELIKSGCFFFDGSGPTMIAVSSSGLPCANRVSEYEEPSTLPASYLWVDAFEGHVWWTVDQLAVWCHNYELVVVVSPELHAYGHLEFWQILHEMIRAAQLSNVGICTDFPDECAYFFGGAS